MRKELIVRGKWLSLLLAALVFVLLAACAGVPASPAIPTEPSLPPAATMDPDAPVSSEDTPVPTPAEPPLGTDVVEGESAIVESIDVLILESFPVQVNAVLRGQLPDGCTSVAESQVTRAGNTFQIRLITRRPADAMCTQALVPFEQTVSLDVLGLPAGTYTVKAYDQTATFELAVDNILAPDPVDSAQGGCVTPSEKVKLLDQDFPSAGIRYCFGYPADFERQPEDIPGMVTIVGPSYGGGQEPVRAWVSVTTFDPAGKDLRAFVDEQLAPYTGVPLTESSYGLGALNATADAIVVDGVPGQTPVRMVFAEYNEIVHVLTFAPQAEAVYPEVQADMERAYEMIMNTWRFGE